MPMPSYAREQILADIGEALDWFNDNPGIAEASQSSSLGMPDGRTLWLFVVSGNLGETIKAYIEAEPGRVVLKKSKPNTFLRPQ